MDNDYCPYCHEHIIVGWKNIVAYLDHIGAKKIHGISQRNLYEMEKSLGFPIFRQRYGRVALHTKDYRDWLRRFQEKGQWWPKGRRGRNPELRRAQQEELARHREGEV